MTLRPVDNLGVRVNAAGYFRVGPDWRLGPGRTRAWRDLDLWLLMAGRGHVESAAGTTPLVPGTCLLLRGGEDYTFVPARGRPLEHYFVHFDYLDDNQTPVPHATLDLPPLVRVLESGVAPPRAVQSLALRGRLGGGGRTPAGSVARNPPAAALTRLPLVGEGPEVVRLRTPSYEPAAQLLSLLIDRVAVAVSAGRRGDADRWMAAALLELRSIDAASRDAPADAFSRWLAETCAAVRRRPQGEHRVDQWAADVGLDTSSFSRRFRKHVGRSPRQFVTAVRMESARQLLRETTMTVTQVARAVGYDDPHFFSRHFKTHTGRNASAMRGR